MTTQSNPLEGPECEVTVLVAWNYSYATVAP